MSQIHRPNWLRIQWLTGVLICCACPVWAGSQAGNLLSADTDVIVTFNPRTFLQDTRDIPFLQRYLDQYRLASKGDEKLLLAYYETQQIQRYEGIIPKEFLERARMIKAACDALGNDPFEDIDLVTIAHGVGDKGFLAIVVEGKFKQRNIALLEQFIGKHFLQMNQGDGAALSFLDNTTLVFASSKKAIEAMQARAAKKTSELPAGVRNLLESGQKAHLSVVVNNLDAHAQRLTKFLRDELVKSTGIDHPIGKAIVGQSTTWIEKWVPDYSALSFGISIRDDETRLQFGLDAKKTSKAEELQNLIKSGSFWGSLALRTIDHDLTRQLAGILDRQRITLKDTTLIVNAAVPHEFSAQILRNPAFDILPDPGKANAKTKPLPGQDMLEKLARQATGIPLWKPDVSTADIEEVRDVAYKTGPEADPFRNRLDLFLPKKKKDFPIVVLVHGGGWTMGENRGAGLYSSVGQFLASQGIGAVLPNYRLSPQVKHPEHIKDVASAVAWTKSHLGKYGADTRQLYFMGHSAGAHLVSLLACDEKYLKAEGMKSADIKGVIPASGIYRIPNGLMCGALGGSGPRSLRIEHMLPLRGDSEPRWKWQPPGFPVADDVFGPAFGDSDKARAEASPIAHVHRNMPPFLILSAEHDLPTLGPAAEEFHAALRDKSCDAKLLCVPKRNHASVMFSAISPQDPAARAILEFLRK